MHHLFEFKETKTITPITPTLYPYHNLKTNYIVEVMDKKKL